MSDQKDKSEFTVITTGPLTEVLRTASEEGDRMLEVLRAGGPPGKYAAIGMLGLAARMILQGQPRDAGARKRAFVAMAQLQYEIEEAAMRGEKCAIVVPEDRTIGKA